MQTRRGGLWRQRRAPSPGAHAKQSRLSAPRPLRGTRPAPPPATPPGRLRGARRARGRRQRCPGGTSPRGGRAGPRRSGGATRTRRGRAPAESARSEAPSRLVGARAGRRGRPAEARGRRAGRGAARLLVSETHHRLRDAHVRVAQAAKGPLVPLSDADEDGGARRAERLRRGGEARVSCMRVA